ncbi:MAG TPA: DotU family type IV/VI secretion system protein [Verrucomicrobiae bacterium]|nr:DotU family type IV/VI secretion system protein [Verrucomicrobiae bacterium]
MTLIELYDDLFLEICDLNRIGRNGGTPQYNAARESILEKLKGVARRAKGNPHLEMQVEKLELPILFFIDSMIAGSALPFAKQWHVQRLAFEKNQRAGDQKFFELLEATLEDPREEARERLSIYYTCLGLGFTGAYAGKLERLRNLMSRMSERIAELKDFDPEAPICPDAYKQVDRRNLIEPPSRKLILLALVFVCFTLASWLFYRKTFKDASQARNEVIERIVKDYGE